MHVCFSMIPSNRMAQGELAAAKQMMGRLLREAQAEAEAEAAQAHSTIASQADELQAMQAQVQQYCPENRLKVLHVWRAAANASSVLHQAPASSATSVCEPGSSCIAKELHCRPRCSGCCTMPPLYRKPLEAVMHVCTQCAASGVHACRGCELILACWYLGKPRATQVLAHLVLSLSAQTCLHVGIFFLESCTARLSLYHHVH